MEIDGMLEREQKKEAHHHFVEALDLMMGVRTNIMDIQDPDKAREAAIKNGNTASDVLFGDVPESATLTLTSERGRGIRDSLGGSFGVTMGQFKLGMEHVFGGVRASNMNELNGILDRYEKARDVLFGKDKVKLVFG